MSLSRRTIGIILIVSLLVVAAGGVAAYRAWSDLQSAPSVHTAEVSQRSVTSIVKGFARARPSVEVSIRSDVSGEITDVYVREGDRVEIGDPLVRLRDDDYEAALQQQRAVVLRARAERAAARADTVRAGQNLRRQQRLFDAGMVPERDVQNARANLEQARARVEAAEAGIAQARALLDRAQEQARQTQIAAPMDGVVTRLNVEVGERVLGTMRVQGTEIMRIGGPEAMEFVVAVPEKEIRQVDLGDRAEILTESFDDRVLEGRVVEVANAARMGEGAIGSASEPEYPVHVRVTSPHRLAARSEPIDVVAESSNAGSGRPVLRPGMSGEVRIAAASIDSVAAVPIGAVTTRNVARLDSAAVAKHGRLQRVPSGRADDLRRVVFVLENEIARMVEVSVGLRSETVAQVSGSLTPGDTVIVGPEEEVARQLAPGSTRSIKTHTEAQAY